MFLQEHAIGNQHGLEGCKVLHKNKSLLQFDLKKIAKKWSLPNIFVKMTQKIQILLDILHKSASQIPATYAYIVCDLSARGCLRLLDRSRLGARDCLR